MRYIPGRIVAAALRSQQLFRNIQPLQIQQEKTLLALLKKSKGTRFGKTYDFERLLSSGEALQQFRQCVPLHTYEQMFNNWWTHALNDEPDVCWPGQVRYFGRSSGTAGASSKHIPVTLDMVRSTNRVGRKQTACLHKFGLPPATFQKQVLLLGSTTSLKKVNEHYEGDLSGICARHMPAWLSTFYYRPGKKIISVPEWNERLELMVKEAWKWDVGTICGVPSWVQILLQKIVAQYNIEHIHELWPDLNLYIHGGVAITNYKEPLRRLFGKKVAFMETYMASEGSFGFQVNPAHGIRLVSDAGIFYEFIPFNSENFDEHGNVRQDAKTILLSEVRKNVNYAIVLSTCAGAWRYIIGDVVKFTNAALGEIVVVGRTRQFLDHCGEHVSIDNLTTAVQETCKALGVNIGEFTVAAERCGDLYAHHWFIGCDDSGVDPEVICKVIDRTLCRLNDDYSVERKSAIKEVRVSVYPNHVFLDYFKWKGREGDMNKFPRVLKEQSLESWSRYLKEKVISPPVSSVAGE